MSILAHLGIATALLGLALALLAGRLPMNPFIGVRVGYTFMSRRVWVRVNREGGVALAVLGVLTAVTDYFLLRPDYALYLYISGSLALVIALVVRAKKLAEYEATVSPPEVRAPKVISEVKPPTPNKPRLALLMALTVATLAVGFAAYPHLPDPVATHFNAEGVPDDFVSKEFFPLVATLFTLPGLIAFLMLAVSRVVPVFLYNPWVPISKFLDVIVEIMAIIQGVEFLAIADTVYFNLSGKHLLNPTLLTLLVVAAIAAMIGRLTYLVLRKS